MRGRAGPARWQGYPYRACMADDATGVPPLAVIGGGNMAHAILHGAAAAGVLDLSRCVVADPSEERRALFPVSAGSASEAVTLAGDGAAVLLAVKPQLLKTVADELAAAGVSLRGRLVVSILAGTTIEKIERLMPGARVVRTMPNTPAQVGLGVTAVCGSAGSTVQDVAAVCALFESVGSVIELDESLMDAFTGVAGSGPAYVFLLAEALAAGGVAAGLAVNDADRAARRMILGAATLLERSERSAAELREAVTSRGGTTAAALDVFESASFRETVRRAVEAARDRGRELSEQDGF